MNLVTSSRELSEQISEILWIEILWNNQDAVMTWYFNEVRFCGNFETAVK